MAPFQKEKSHIFIYVSLDSVYWMKRRLIYFYSTPFTAPMITVDKKAYLKRRDEYFSDLYLTHKVILMLRCKLCAAVMRLRPICCQF